jgi:hypothetical protein
MQTQNDNKNSANRKKLRRRNRPKGKRELSLAGIPEFELVDKIMSLTIPPNLMRSSPIPPFQVRKLTFQFQAVVQGAAPFTLTEFRINGAFSPDTVGTPSGFNEMAAMYTLYVVTHVKVKFSVVNNEPALPVSFGLIFRDIQPSTIINTYQKAVNALEVSPSTGPNSVGETSGMSVFRSGWYKIMPAAVIGQAFSYFGTTNYGAGVTANPVALVWCDFVQTSFSAGTNLTNGCFLTLTMQLTTRFYSGAVLEQ